MPGLQDLLPPALQVWCPRNVLGAARHPQPRLLTGGFRAEMISPQTPHPSPHTAISPLSLPTRHQAQRGEFGMRLEGLC